jgi:Holliday junction resolvase RusA-like endonuclease
MKHFNIKIKGVPYSQHKRRGNVDALTVWTDAVVDQTRRLPKVEEACLLKVTFLLPPNKFPSNYKYGPDLDNLLKRFLDALNQTIFSNSVGKDSCAISINVTKARVDSEKDAGALLEVLPVSLSENNPAAS